MIYREVREEKAAWDAPLSPGQRDQWLKWEKHLPNEVAVPCALPTFKEEIDSIEWYDFGDASTKGVAGAVYAVDQQPSGATQGLVVGKARLAKKGLTIPRLELVSAYMTANLIVSAIIARGDKFSNIVDEVNLLIKEYCEETNLSFLTHEQIDKQMLNKSVF